MTTIKRWTPRAGLPTGVVLLVNVPLVPVEVSVVFGPSYSDMSLQLMSLGAATSHVFFALTPFYHAVGQVGFWTKGLRQLRGSGSSPSWALVKPWGFVGVVASAGLGTLVFNLAMAGSMRSMWRKWSFGACGSPPAAVLSPLRATRHEPCASKADPHRLSVPRPHRSSEAGWGVDLIRRSGVPRSRWQGSPRGPKDIMHAHRRG
jgi:hypothetical protein